MLEGNIGTRGTNLGFVGEVIDERASRDLDDVAAVVRVTLPSALQKHLDTTDSAIELCQVPPSQRGSGYFELLRTCRRVVHSLSQYSGGRIKPVHEILPVLQIRRLIDPVVVLIISPTLYMVSIDAH